MIKKIIFLIYYIRYVFTCNSGASWEEPISNTNDVVDNGAVDPFFFGPLNDSKKWYAHWPEPKDGIVGGVNYYDWMKEYKDKLKAQEEEELKRNAGMKKIYPDDANSDFPSHWTGLGPGIGGVAPPPWAIVEGSSGKPDICYLPPKLGKCMTYVLRWGFNPYKGDCAEFVYSGCDGNQNNFYSKKRCLEICLNPPKSNCVHNDDIKLSAFEKWIKHLPHGEF